MGIGLADPVPVGTGTVPPVGKIPVGHGVIVVEGVGFTGGTELVGSGFVSEETTGMVKDGSIGGVEDGVEDEENDGVNDGVNEGVTEGIPDGVAED